MTQATGDVRTRGLTRRVAAHVVSCLRSAPLTFLWLAVLLATSIAQHLMSPADLDRVLGARSTNLEHLTHDPIHVLWTSLFWIDGAFWLPWAVAFCVFHVPAERWLGSWRWLLVGASAHIMATFVSQGVLGLAIREGVRSADMIHVQDVGVSYFFAGVVGVLTYRIARPWRWIYLAGVLIYYGVPVITDLSFTNIGHLSAALVGLAWYPITRGRGEAWDPAAAIRAHRSSARDRSTTGRISAR
ncbi:rhomboid-like protein [Gordonia sp. 852002-10350_SCH5691597]|uniref:rhomboid-like protein n=1 Tax=Gordonia sp. 852002-10350_SCH5691597 TaxID=1834085 RepID=UPI000AA5C17E|nr:rhomboid-like protein [Gordonia sp. 852002-10350_SCH5691597]